ncbi:MAG: hypothetical protein CVU43_05605 [Chloroflexi bacterium HGW-Chloroflexi-5]|jgi:hypothetical protein|nr:MAG: hypothetical protein CVU43_05605 [Chloroflexi bacterium HGW-Chloroflexi-5]
MASKYDDLEKLADLKNKGIITEEEFNTKKKEILGGSAVESSVGQKDLSTIKTDPIVLSVHSKGNEADINIDHTKAFEITCEALKYIKYMKVEDANSIQGYIKISTSFDLMALKNPEIIEISIKSNSPQSSNIKIKSKIKNALGSGSKDNINNIFLMIDKCAKAHYSNEELKPIDYEKVKTVDEAVNVISKQAQDSFNTEKNTMLAPFFKPKALKVILIISAIFLFIGLITTLTDTTKKSNTSNTVSENDPIKILEKAPITQIDPAELGQIFNLMSEHTDIQRENKKKEIMGKIIAWKLPVYEVKKVKDNIYRIDTIGVYYVGTIAKVTARNAQESAFIEGLKTGSLITYKGKITDITLREIKVEPAILFGESAQVPVETPKVEAPIAQQQPAAAVNNNKVNACVDAWVADFRKENGEDAIIRVDILEEVTRMCEEQSRPHQVEPTERAGATASAPIQTQVASSTPTANAHSGNTDGDLKEYVESITASSSTYDNTNNINYSPNNLLDNKDGTAWAIDLKKDPNPNLVIRFKQPVVITGMKLIPGYKKFMIVDRYLQNHKLKRIGITYGNTSVQDEFTFDQASNYQALTWQYKATKNQIATQSVTVKVLETYPGITQGNRSASHDLCVSEFHFLGHLSGGNN